MSQYDSRAFDEGRPFDDEEGAGAPLEDPRFADGPPRKKSGAGCGIWAAVGIGATLLILLCCGGGGYALWQAGKGAVATAVRDDLAGNPVLNEQLGGITSLELDFMASVQPPNDASDVYVFDAVGPKGTGRLVVDTDDRGPVVTVESGALTLPDGTVHDLFPEQLDAPAEIEERMEADPRFEDADAGDVRMEDLNPDQ